MTFTWSTCVVGRKPSEEKLIVNPKHKSSTLHKNGANEDNRRTYCSIYCGEIYCTNQNLKYIQRSTRYTDFVHVHLHNLFIIIAICFLNRRSTWDNCLTL